MTKITVTITKASQPLPTGISFAGTSVAVTDNAGQKIGAVMVNGTETPPWTVVVQGSEGPNEAVAVIQDLDTNGNPMGNPITVTETGTGGQPQTFQASTGATITVE